MKLYIFYKVNRFLLQCIKKYCSVIRKTKILNKVKLTNSLLEGVRRWEEVPLRHHAMIFYFLFLIWFNFIVIE